MKRGDRLFLYTDGVTEAFDKEEKAYGEERLETFIMQQMTTPTEEMVRNAIIEINAFSEGVSQSDDITLLALRFNGRA